jgi:hypothetical protein
MWLALVENERTTSDTKIKETLFIKSWLLTEGIF